jgi:hypothetical protein
MAMSESGPNSDIAGSKWSYEERHLETHQSAEVAYRTNVILAKLRLQELTIAQGSPRHACSP